MAATSRGVRALLTPPRSCPPLPSRCSRTPLYLRAYSAAAAEATPPDPPTETPPPPAESSPSPRYAIKAGIILTRPPLLTRELTPFESAFYFYQKRLAERLTLPFRHQAFFKRDTPAQLDFLMKLRERQGIIGREIGQYNGRSSQAWDDELLVGDKLSDPATLTDILLKDAEMRVSEDAEVIPEEERVPADRPQPRRTEADEKGDVRRLDRGLERTLYLVVRKEGKWIFPCGSVGTDEALHETAKRVLAQAAGENMNTWIVGRVPVAHVVNKPIVGEDGTEAQRGEKIFFLKGRIMAGQANISGNELGVDDFKWLTKEELEKELEPEYFQGVRNMMADR